MKIETKKKIFLLIAASGIAYFVYRKKMADIQNERAMSFQTTPFEKKRSLISQQMDKIASSYKSAQDSIVSSYEKHIKDLELENESLKQKIAWQPVQQQYSKPDPKPYYPPTPPPPKQEPKKEDLSNMFKGTGKRKLNL